MHVPALLLALSLSGDVHVDEVRGFRVEVPEEWSTQERDMGEEGFALVIAPPGSIGQVGLTIIFAELDEGEGMEELLAQARRELEKEQYSGLEELEQEIAGKESPMLRATLDHDLGEFRIEASFLVDGDAFVFQRVAPVDSFAEHEAAFDGIVASFARVAISEAGLAERRLAELAALCGSEVDWAESWEEAAKRAREEKKLVLVTAFLYPSFAINDTPRNTVFMDEDVIELTNERFVPFWYERGSNAAFVGSYGVSGSTFGQALLLVDPAGEVLLETSEASNSDMAYAFLREGLRRHPEHAGDPVQDEEPPADRIALAGRHVARGELEAALERLEGETSGRAHRLRSKALRLQRDGEEALAALALAREAGGEPEAELLLEEAGLLMRERRYDESKELYERVIAEHAGTEQAAEALIGRGLLDLRTRDEETAVRRWQRVVDEHAESRWAWQAAAALRSLVLDVDVRPDFGWPDEAVASEVLVFSEPAPLPADRADEAAEGALAWLLAAQREDGSWISTTQLSAVEDMGPDPMVDAMTSLAGRALLRRRDQEGVEDAARRALAFVLAEIERREEEPPLVLFMDYMTWSDSMMLGFLSESAVAGLADMEALMPPVLELVEDLAGRQQEGGGWSYYKTSDLEGSDAPAQSISFTTAAGILALLEARAAGFPIPDDVVDPAISALSRMRSDEGIFSYFLYHATGDATPATAAPGAVGRGPACELALLRAGKSDDERLRGSLDLFLEHAHLYTAEQGKVLMHAGPDAQGCHYLFFDYAHAALAHEALAADPETRARVLELVMDCRQPDGSFLDTPILGRSYGTAMALIALDALSNAEAR